MSRLMLLVPLLLSLGCSGSTVSIVTEENAAEFVVELGGSFGQFQKSLSEPVLEVNLNKKKLTDTGMKKLAALKNLTSLSLSDTKVTDAGLKELAGLKNLSFLYLDGTKVTDAGLKELKEALPTLYLY